MNWSLKPRKISVVVDNDSWILPYAENLVEKINAAGDDAILCRSYEEVAEGLVAFYLGCMTISPNQVRKRNALNLVVHESDLPQGRGFAPVSWQILEGKNRIPVCLIEAVDEADSGNIYMRRELMFEGHELCGEIRHAQGEMTVNICLDFLTSKQMPEPMPQDGVATYYKKRRPDDSKLDINKTIEEQFNLLRIVDNKLYPAFFEKHGCRYYIKIEKTHE